MKNRGKFNFDAAVKALSATPLGRERNMYPHVRDLFVHVLGHDRGRIQSDSRQEGGDGAPDLAVRAPTGVRNVKGAEIMHDWIVAEAKDEPGAFASHESREKIFNEKAKYVALGTEFFVMIDPRRIVARPVALRSQLRFDPSSDVVMEWAGATEEKFLEIFEMLRVEHAENLSALRKFRAGDESQIAAVKVDLPPAQKSELTAEERKRLAMARGDFLQAVRKSTAILQGACIRALQSLDEEIAAMRGRLDEFDKKWKGHVLSFEPVDIKGKDVQGMDEMKAHGRETRRLSSYIRARQPIAKLADRALPAYYDRTGSRDIWPFAAESANLILARVLLMRFFEDHGFFGEKKYVCNGGVKVLQEFMRHRERGYAVALETAYYEGAKLYADAFDYTDLDWALKCEDLQASRAVELTMLYFSRFDFSTVSGDILAGIYDRFLDRRQRKQMGEFYTPPSVARHIAERLDISADDVVFDPACGSGTFLLEAFAKMTNGDVREGRGTLAQAEAVLRNIGGNDLNPFSAVMTRIQILWHLLPLKEELKKRTTKPRNWAVRENVFPEIRVDDSYNAILPRGLGHRGTPFEWFDEPISDAVIGNPPYVRPERRYKIEDSRADEYFREIGGVGKNLYDLFIYKALSSWCRPSEDGKRPGRIGFIVPLSFCDSGNSAPLRKLFALGGRFRIMEIADMEAIAPFVFDASVNPIILFAENRPAKKTDEIVVRIAGESCIVDKDKKEFDFSRAKGASFRYADVWTADGRILTKTNAARQKIIDKMRAAPPLAAVARPYWTGRTGNKIMQWRDAPPKNPSGNGVVWNEKKKLMLARGAVLRGQGNAGDGGLPLYKGANVCACRIEGAPVKVNWIPESVSDPSFWRHPDILPARGYAFLRISAGTTAARFNPKEIMLLDTATLFFPDKEWEAFPFDAALLSRVFQLYYAVYLREGAVQKMWSNLYPRNLRMLPWPPALKKSAAKLEKLRAVFLLHCENISDRAAALNRALQKCGASPLADNRNIRLGWSHFIQTQKIKMNVPDIRGAAVHPQNGMHCISLDGQLPLEDAAWFSASDGGVARRAAAAMTVFHEQKIGLNDILRMLVPKDDAALKQFADAVSDYDGGGEERRMEKVFRDIDDIVGAAFGLSADEIAFIQREMREDDFLRHVRPNLPFSGKRMRGLSESLASSSRYRGGETE